VLIYFEFWRGCIVVIGEVTDSYGKNAVSFIGPPGISRFLVSAKSYLALAVLKVSWEK
jgi:hypothetical protein